MILFRMWCLFATGIEICRLKTSTTLENPSHFPPDAKRLATLAQLTVFHQAST